jgi:hypothetical protein
MRYVKLFLCVNNSENSYQEEYQNWLKYFNFVINKEKVLQDGYFWAITEIKLYEYSAVLWGDNEYTPTLDEPLDDTQKAGDEPLESTQWKENFYNGLLTQKLF